MSTSDKDEVGAGRVSKAWTRKQGRIEADNDKGVIRRWTRKDKDRQ